MTNLKWPEVLKTSEVLQEKMKTEDDLDSYIQDDVLIPIAEFCGALYGGLLNSDGRLGVSSLLRSIIYVVDRAFPQYGRQIKKLFKAKNVGGGSPNITSLCVGHTVVNMTDEKKSDDAYLEKQLSQNLTLDKVVHSRTHVTDVAVVYKHADVVQNLITLEIKSASVPDLITPETESWMQGLSGLQYRNKTYSVLITPRYAKVFCMTLKPKYLWTEHMSFSLTRKVPKEDEEGAMFQFNKFMEFVHCLMKIIYHEFQLEIAA